MIGHHALLFFGRRSPRPDRNHFVPHLDLYIGVGEQVFVPPRIVGRATFRSDNQIVVAVTPVDSGNFFVSPDFRPIVCSTRQLVLFQSWPILPPVASYWRTCSSPNRL